MMRPCTARDRLVILAPRRKLHHRKCRDDLHPRSADFTRDTRCIGFPYLISSFRQVGDRARPVLSIGNFLSRLTRINARRKNRSRARASSRKRLRIGAPAFLLAQTEMKPSEIRVPLTLRCIRRPARGEVERDNRRNRYAASILRENPPRRGFAVN